MAGLVYSSFVAESICRFYNASTAFLNQHKNTIYSTANTLFYSCAQPMPEQPDSLLRRVQRAAFNNFHDLQTIFTIANIGRVVYSNQKIILHFSHPLVQASCQTWLGAYLPATALALITLSATGWVLSKVMQHNETLYKSLMQIISGAVQLTEVIQSLALAVLTSHKVPFLAYAAMNGYSFYKNNQLNWLSVHDCRDVNNEWNVDKISMTYSALLFPKKLTDENCTICQDENPDQVFCTNGHAFHHGCLEEYLKRCQDSLYQIQTCRRIDIDHYANGRYTHTTHSYDLEIDKENLPHCPQCRECPPQHHVSAIVDDRLYGACGASVYVLDPNPNQEKDDWSRFEKHYAIYNCFQAVLGLLQQIPEFVGGATLVRRFMIVPDILMGVIAEYQLITTTYDPQKLSIVRIAITALAAIFCFVGLEHFFLPKEDLSLLNLRGVTAQWKYPLFEKVHRVLDIYRGFTTLEQICLSDLAQDNYFNRTPAPAIHAISLLSQAVGLVSAMNVPWLRVNQKGLGKIQAECGMYAILSSTLLKSAEGVKSAVSYIVDLQQKIFNEGTIVRYYEGGWRLLVRATIEKTKDCREYLFKPFIWTLSGITGTGSYFSDNLPLSLDLSTSRSSS